MFTGIAECMGEVKDLKWENNVLKVWVQSPISSELKIDESVCHDGVCLTVVETDGKKHAVQVIQETLDKSTAGQWGTGNKVNLERSMPANGRFDGHIVQGHVDGVGEVRSAELSNGQMNLVIEHQKETGITVRKGSICVNGVSLTVVDSEENSFSVALIPYTREHTNLGALNPGDIVNLEFDIIGKYLEKLVSGK